MNHDDTIGLLTVAFVINKLNCVAAKFLSVTVFNSFKSKQINKLGNLLRVFSCKIAKYSDAEIYANIGLLFDIAFHIM